MKCIFGFSAGNLLKMHLQRKTRINAGMSEHVVNQNKNSINNFCVYKISLFLKITL